MISQSLSLPITTPTLGALLRRAMSVSFEDACEDWSAFGTGLRRPILPSQCRADACEHLSHHGRSLTMRSMAASILRPFAARLAAMLAAACIGLAVDAQPTDRDFAAA